MHTFWIRANAVFFFGLGVLAVLAFLNVLTTWYQPPGPPVVNRLQVHELRRLHKFKRSDQAILTLDLDLDFEPVWTWNVKQIFVFVMADYKGTVMRRNSVVIFDKILKSKETARITGVDLIKYALVDREEALLDTSIVLKLGYDIHPLFGPLQLYGTGRKIIPLDDPQIGRVNFTFPTVYN